MPNTSEDPVDHARTTRQHAGETMKDGVVTIRNRDTMLQEKVKVAEIESWLRHAIRTWKRPEKKAASAG